MSGWIQAAMQQNTIIYLSGFSIASLVVGNNMNGINQEEVSNQSTLENYTLGYCWYPEQEYYSWCPSDLPKKTIHPDPGKFF